MPSVISSVQTLFEQVHEIVEATKDETVYVGLPAIGCGIGGLNLYSVVRHINRISESVYEETRRRVVPVFYIREGDGFDDDLMELSHLDTEGIMIVEDEQEIIDEEG